MDISYSELMRRLFAIAEYTSSHSDSFEVSEALVRGDGSSLRELHNVQAAVGVELPDLLQEVCAALAGTRWSWALKVELEQEWDADVTGASGGFHWLRPDEMHAAHERLEEATGIAVLPFAADPDGCATWLCVGVWDHELALLQVGHDGQVEPSDLEDFLDQWSRGGFRIGARWEDQPGRIVERFRQVLGLPEELPDP